MAQNNSSSKQGKVLATGNIMRQINRATKEVYETKDATEAAKLLETTKKWIMTGIYFNPEPIYCLNRIED